MFTRTVLPAGHRPLGLRLWLTVAAALAMLVSGLPAGLPPASAATPDTNTWYQLINRHSGQALEVWEWSTADGGNVVQYTDLDGFNQQWRFVSSGGGYYRLINRHSGKALDVYERSTADGGNVVQWTDLDGFNQQWSTPDAAAGYVKLLNRNSGKALEVFEWSTATGANVVQWADSGGANQHWQLVPTGSVGGGGDPGGGDPGGGTCGSGSYQAEVTVSGGTWTARNGGSTVYSGGDMLSAMQAAVDSLSSGRTSKQRVVVRGSGSMSAGSRLSLPSYTVLDVCGTINVTGSGSGDQAVVYARGVRDVEVQHLTVTGGPLYGIFIRNGTNITLGQIDLRLSGGLGVRIDNHGDRSVRTTNVRIDDVSVSGTGSHGVETYGVDGLTVGTGTARDTGYSGLLLNDTINATVGTVDAQGAGTGTGYAAFRMANRNGRVGSGYPTNVRVGTVIARGGGRGVFCVSESGGAVIDRVDISGTGSNSILIENCYNVTIAGVGGTVNGSDVRIASRSEFPVSSDITLANLTLTNSAINESPCGTNTVIENVTLDNSQNNAC